MRKKTLRFIPLFMISLLLFAASFAGAFQKEPLTIAEKSQYTATSRYQDVMDFIWKLQEKSSLLRVETLGVSTEGRKIPLLILGQPVPSSPLQLRYDDRAVVYLQANIHAGEVEGKEASLMLTRDILFSDNPSYLDDLIILVCPILNPDGNEKISQEHRRNQIGPKKGVGVRYNGQNLDLNRDSMKLESPELQGLVQNVLLRWDPLLFVDCHTTNGSYHREPVTYSWPLNPNGNPAIIEYMRSNMMPWIRTHLKKKYGTLSIPHGYFMDHENPEKGWRIFGHLPRYVTNYMGLRNRLSILDENYAYADYKTRVHGCYNFLRSILDYCSKNKNEIIELVAKADRQSVHNGLNPSSSPNFGIQFERHPLPEKLTILGWKMIPQEKGWPRVKKTDKKRTYKVPFYADFQPVESVTFPYAYLFPTPDSIITQKLQQHGIMMEKLIKPVELKVESFHITQIQPSKRIYQGHHLNSIKGKYKKETKTFPKGTLVVKTAQPLGYLAAYLLEPQSDDGLLVWNFFDRYLVEHWGDRPQTYPVFKLLKPVPLTTQTCR
ncbi:M14 family metallopeptidase [bacterium]|nr:M14 family metallopeptidase [bacterium]